MVKTAPDVAQLNLADFVLDGCRLVVDGECAQRVTDADVLQFLESPAAARIIRMYVKDCPLITNQSVTHVSEHVGGMPEFEIAVFRGSQITKEAASAFEAQHKARRVYMGHG